MRTYYTWKTFELEDVTYYTFKMGLLTVAETSTGLIISCLPILPRFFRFIGPQICKNLSLSASKIKIANFKHSMTDKLAFQMCHDPYHAQILIGDDSITLVRPGSKSTAAESTERDSTTGPVPGPNGRQSAADNDLESGQHGIFNRAARVGMSLDTPGMTSPDSMEPKVARVW